MSSFIKRFFALAKFDSEENLRRIKEGKKPIYEIPSNLANPMMDYMLERSYLEDISSREEFVKEPVRSSYVKWIKISRLPVSPLRIDDYDLLSRWQGVLSSMHAWHQKLLFLLQRKDGYTSLYVGHPHDASSDVIGKCETAFTSCMPGVKLERFHDLDRILAINDQIMSADCGGAVTGIPSFRKGTQFGVLQTLDKLATGFKSAGGIEADFSLLVIAEPMSDIEITDIIGTFQNIGSEIHTEVLKRVSTSESVSYGEGASTSANLGVSIGGGRGVINDIAKTILNSVNPLGVLAKATSFKTVMEALGIGGSFSLSRSVSSNDGVSYGESITNEYLNKFAQYTESLTDKHCERLRSGRNLGFWNTGVYVLANSVDDVNLITGILRSVYSGDNTYIEPIRTHLFHSSDALESIKNYQLVPIINPETADAADGTWHILGKNYQYVSTPVNTEELSLFTSLPRKDVPGIRFVKNAVKFASNPAEAPNADSIISLGRIMNMGEMQNNEYTIDFNALVRHSLITGSTGCGKTNTCVTIIKEVQKKKRPVLIIEPAKEEWVEWALEMNKTLPDGEKFKIFEPGVTAVDGQLLGNLMLNPFQPAAYKDAPIDMQTRCEQITALINASLPTGDVLPVIMDEAIYAYLRESVEDFEEEEMDQLSQYPLLEGVLPVAKKVLVNRGYEPRVRDGLVAALDTRFKYLTRGKRGKILNNLISTPYDTLFNGNCVINLSKIANAKDKALIMSIILIALYEYRKSVFAHDAEYRKHAKQNELMHLTVIEEAHNVLARPSAAAENSGNPQQVVADLFANMLAEIRSMGEGLMIIDQVPTKLIPDVIKNTNYKICHRITSMDDSNVMATALALRDDQKGLIPSLEPGNAIISGDRDDAASWVKIYKNK